MPELVLRLNLRLAGVNGKRREFRRGFQFGNAITWLQLARFVFFGFGPLASLHVFVRVFIRPLQYPHPFIRLQQWMNEAASPKFLILEPKALEPKALDRMASEQDQRISEVVKREQLRLRNFIRRRVADPRDAEDVLQDVFYRLVEANRLLMPIEHVTGWLFRVARNRITDLFRKQEPANFSDMEAADEDDERLPFEDLLPSPDEGPESGYARNVLLHELEWAVAELPQEQREVFVAHEFEGRSFKELSAKSGVSVNTLLSRKRYAVWHLRERLQRVYDEFGR